MFPGAKTFPQIKINGHNIGGYDKLGNYLEETGYNGTGWTL
jgi:glutaredoxin